MTVKHLLCKMLVGSGNFFHISMIDQQVSKEGWSSLGIAIKTHNLNQNPSQSLDAENCCRLPPFFQGEGGSQNGKMLRFGGSLVKPVRYFKLGISKLHFPIPVSRSWVQAIFFLNPRK